MNEQPGIGWNAWLAAVMADNRICPVCLADGIRGGICSACSADLRGTPGRALWAASNAASAALRTRERLLRAIPGTQPVGQTLPEANRQPLDAPAHAPAVVSSPAVQGLPPAELPGSDARDRSAGATLQSVFAVAGAGLFAIAAVVFTFFNPDLADRVLRSAIVGGVTLGFLGAAWWLSRRALRFSAEAVGGLGLVFVGIDVWAFAQIGVDAAGSWSLAAVACLVAAAVLAALGTLAGVRAWSFASLIAFTVVPAMLGYSGGAPLLSALGHLGSMLVAAALLAWTPRLRAGAEGASRPETDETGVDGADETGMPGVGGTSMPGAGPAARVARAERRTLGALQLIALLIALPMCAVGAALYGQFLAVSGLFAGYTVAAFLASRHTMPRIWSVLAGAGAVAAFAAAPLSLDWNEPWGLPLLAAGAAVGLVVVRAATPALRSAAPAFLNGGGFAMLLGVAVGPAILGTIGLGMTLLRAPRELYESTEPTSPWAFTAALALAALGFGGAAALSWRERRGQRDPLLPVCTVTALICATLAALSPVSFGLIPHTAQLLLALGVAALIGLVLRQGVAQDPARSAPLVPRVRLSRSPAVRIPLALAAHVALALGAVVSWDRPSSVPLAGVAALAVLALLGSGARSRARFAYVGVGYAYGLVVAAATLQQWGVEGIARDSIAAALGLLGAIAVTFLRRIGAREWYAVLVVTLVPFLGGIARVLVERSGWTALTTALMFGLALALLVTRRPGLVARIRVLASAMLVPSIAVFVVCMGAQLLPGSASPVTLPIIAAAVAAVLACSAAFGSVLSRNGLGDRTVREVRAAIEGSALLTGSIAVLLALVRDAAGFGIAGLVLLLLGAGSVLSGIFAGRRYAWWVAGVAFSGALWCVWGLAEVSLLEAYLLPPLLGAALAAVWLTGRGRVSVRLESAPMRAASVRAESMRAASTSGAPTSGVSASAAPASAAPTSTVPLYTAALVLAVLPIQALLVSGDAGVIPRGAGLLCASCLLLAVGAGFARAARYASLAAPSFAVAGLAGLAGAIFAARAGIAGAPFVVCFLLSAAGALGMGLASRGIRAVAGPRLRASRWLGAPAAIALAAGCWFAIERDWFSIWAMWALMLAYLTAMVAIVWRQRAGRVALPPVWVLFMVALATAIVAWSPRELRVETFSLPLGLMLTLAGAVAMRRVQGVGRLGAGAGAGVGADANADASADAGADADADISANAGSDADAGSSGDAARAGGLGARASAETSTAVPAEASTRPAGGLWRALGEWPLGWGGSWALLGPGIVVAVLASILATFTDPQTWRAILVMLLALTALLAGARLRLAAPFILGLVVLPIENVFVFSVQIGRGIDSMPWWITLAAVGAVLLSIAVVTERRAGEAQTLGARVRDLR